MQWPAILDFANQYFYRSANITSRAGHLLEEGEDGETPRLISVNRLLRAAIGLDLPGFVAKAPELRFFCRRPCLANAGRQRIVLPTVASKIPSRTARRTQAKQRRRKSTKAGKPALPAKMVNGSKHGRTRLKEYLEKRRDFHKNLSLCPVQFCRYNR